ncbi:hypothetical protein [Streptomyces sp. R02]|uniref:Uncharacterized protein n=1 Tax=Streptomyces sp. R02 TaxID=3238623 RepID=A0AB39LQR0_9ACTN
MDNVPQRVREIGARRLRLKAELRNVDSELRSLLPTARESMTHEDIRSATGLSVPTIRLWSMK